MGAVESVCALPAVATRLAMNLLSLDRLAKSCEATLSPRRTHTLSAVESTVAAKGDCCNRTTRKGSGGRSVTPLSYSLWLAQRHQSNRPLASTGLFRLNHSLGQRSVPRLGRDGLREEYVQAMLVEAPVREQAPAAD